MQINRIEQAAKIVLNDGVIAYPTETIYGLGCQPTNQQGIQRICALKQRNIDQGFILLAAKLDQFYPYIQSLDEQEIAMILTPSSSPTTWLVSARADCNPALTGERDTLAIRITTHPDTYTLCEKVGAIISTSANVHGLASLQTAQQIRMLFGPLLNFILTSDVAGCGKPSIICDLATGNRLR